MTMKFIYILSAVVLLRVIYKYYFSPLNTIEDYHQRAFAYETILLSKRLSINFLKKGLQDERLTQIEKASIKLRLGILYYRLRDYQQSVDYFEMIINYIKKGKFPYTRNLSAIVLSYYNLGKKEKARELYHYLLAKESYDMNFSKLRYLDRYIWK